MLIYNYDERTKEYLGCMEAYLDPLETLNKGESVYVIPPNFTNKGLPKFKKGYAIVLNDGEWEYVEDHRGLTVYNKKNGKEFVIQELGPIPNIYTSEKPVIFEDLKQEKIKEINLKASEERQKIFIVNKIKCSVERFADLNIQLASFGDFSVINLVQDDEDVQVTKEELQEAVKVTYIKSMLIPEKRKELLKEMNSIRSKKKLQEFIPTYDLDEETKKLIGFSIEELNERFTK